MKHLKSPLVRRAVKNSEKLNRGSPLSPGHLRDLRKLFAGGLEDWLSLVREEVWASGKLRIQGFGTFSVKERKAKRVEQRGAGLLGAPGPVVATIVVPAHKVVTFRASSNWRRRNG